MTRARECPTEKRFRLAFLTLGLFVSAPPARCRSTTPSMSSSIQYTALDPSAAPARKLKSSTKSGLAVLALIVVAGLSYRSTTASTTPFQSRYFAPTRAAPDSCTPAQYSVGEWTSKPSSLDQSSVFAASGFAGCRSTFVPSWHLATEPDMSMGAYRRQAAQWEWVPSSGCTKDAFSVERLVQDLVQRGGWLLVGGMSYSACLFTTSEYRC